MQHAAGTLCSTAQGGQMYGQTIDTQLADLVPTLEHTIQAQATELAVLRSDLVTLESNSRKQVEELRGDLLVRQRQLEEAERRWRCHRHDGETKLRMLEEQARIQTSNSTEV